MTMDTLTTDARFRLGRWNNLSITRFTDHGAYLDGGAGVEILMPRRYVQPEMRPHDVVRVFVYLDQSERLVGTTEQPLAEVGQFAWLKVNWVNEFGAFLDWGLMKDLFVPFSEQKRTMEEGRRYVVHLHVDPQTCRIVGSAKVERYLRRTRPVLHRDEAVEVLVWQKTPLGFKVIVNHAFAGQLYDDQLFGAELHTGDRLTAYVVQVRPDYKIDLSLQRLGKSRFRDFAEVLLGALREADGFLPLTDNAPADEISARFGVSKKTFKRAVGTLYRRRLVTLEPEGIRLLPADGTTA